MNLSHWIIHHISKLVDNTPLTLTSKCLEGVIEGRISFIKDNQTNLIWVESTADGARVFLRYAGEIYSVEIKNGFGYYALEDNTGASSNGCAKKINATKDVIPDTVDEFMKGDK